MALVMERRRRWLAEELARANEAMARAEAEQARAMADILQKRLEQAQARADGKRPAPEEKP
jgi:hypothetical protein